MPGIMEIQKLNERLQANHALHVVPLHSSLSSQSQKLIFNKAPPGLRKVVLATNIAETSITIDDVTVVVDTGRVKEMRYDGLRRMGILEQTWVSQASATQRAGRAGESPAHIWEEPPHECCVILSHCILPLNSQWSHSSFKFNYRKHFCYLL